MKNTDTAKKPSTKSYNPFGKAMPVKSALEILQGSFGIGIRKYDRGADQWDATRIDEKTLKPAPGWVHVPDESLECVVEFSVNEGKGTGRQCIPANEFVDYVASLRFIVDSDFAERQVGDRTEYRPTNIVATESFKLVRPRQTVTVDGKQKTEEIKDAPRNVVSVRCTGGKGAKPMLVPRGEFEGVVEALEGIAAKIEEFEAQAWANYQQQVDAGETPDTDLPKSEDESETDSTPDSDEVELDLDLDSDPASDE